MNWSTPATLRAQVQRRWERGDLLRAGVSATASWPLRLAFKAPTATDLADRFDAVRAWAGTVTAISHVRFDWREWAHRVQGRQRLPVAAFVDSLADALAIVGEVKAAATFRALWDETAAVQPAILPWLLHRPLAALGLADRWSPLLAVVGWLRAHPRPAIYVRQLDVPGVDSKFVEANRGVLAEWLDLALPADAIDAAATGSTQFARRCLGCRGVAPFPT